jgi:hypothetical protein
VTLTQLPTVGMHDDLVTASGLAVKEDRGGVKSSSCREMDMSFQYF